MKRLSLILLCVLLQGCAAAAPPTSRMLTQHPELKDKAGVLLMVDVCIKRDTVGDDDFFVIENSQLGAATVVKAVTDYFSEIGLTPREKIVPFICGALHDSENLPKKVADRLDGRVEEKIQPFAVDPALEQDSQYVAALQHIATHANQSALSGNNAELNAQLLADMEKTKTSAAVVAMHSDCSSLIYLGIFGNSLTKGKAFAQGVGQFAVAFTTGMVTAMSTGGYGLLIFPHAEKDGYQMTAALMDIGSGSILASNVVHGNGDPMNPEVISQRDPIHLLLREVVFSNILK